MKKKEQKKYLELTQEVKEYIELGKWLATLLQQTGEYNPFLLECREGRVYLIPPIVQQPQDLKPKGLINYIG